MCLWAAACQSCQPYLGRRVRWNAAVSKADATWRELRMQTAAQAELPQQQHCPCLEKFPGDGVSAEQPLHNSS